MNFIWINFAIEVHLSITFNKHTYWEVFFIDTINNIFTSSNMFDISTMIKHERLNSTKIKTDKTIDNERSRNFLKSFTEDVIIDEKRTCDTQFSSQNLLNLRELLRRYENMTLRDHWKLNETYKALYLFQRVTIENYSRLKIELHWNTCKTLEDLMIRMNKHYEVARAKHEKLQRIVARMWNSRDCSFETATSSMHRTRFSKAKDLESWSWKNWYEFEWL